MPERSLIIDDVQFVRSRDTARAAHLAADYVSRLARGGFISGRQVEGLWFVNVASLTTFLAEQERQKETWHVVRNW